MHLQGLMSSLTCGLVILYICQSIIVNNLSYKSIPLHLFLSKHNLNLYNSSNLCATHMFCIIIIIVVHRKYCLLLLFNTQYFQNNLSH